MIIKFKKHLIITNKSSILYSSLEGRDSMENELVEIDNKDIKNLIHTIRGKQVMLDSDVAMLYQTETKKINQAVKINIERFPEKFCF